MLRPRDDLPSTVSNSHGYHPGVQDRGSARDFGAAWEPRIGVLVVAYNAAATLAADLDRLPASFRRRSTTSSSATTPATTTPTRSASPTRRGRPAADRGPPRAEPRLRRQPEGGYRWAIAHGLDIVVLLHGDGQYAPEVHRGHRRAARSTGEADAVFGSRMLHGGARRAGGMPLYKYVGNRILTAVAEQGRRPRADRVAQRLPRLPRRRAAATSPSSPTPTTSTSTPRSSSGCTPRGRRSSRCRSRPTTATRSATSTACATPRT